MTSTLLRATFATPVGNMVALASPDALCALEFVAPTRQAMLSARLQKHYGDPQITDGENAILASTRRWLGDYFAGRIAAPDFPLDQRGTDFELQVWKRLVHIPVGTRATYAEIAQKLNKPQGARAVGGASRRNSIGLIVPCHRVVGSSGALTGYGGGLEQKHWLLAHEETAISRRHTSSAKPFPYIEKTVSC